MDQTKKPLTTLFRNNAETPEGKYHVQRRDGTTVEWPSFVLGAKDPIAAVALRAYATEVVRVLLEDPKEAEALGLTKEFAEDVFREADLWDEYRKTHGKGDPGMGRHRKDDPEVVAKMRKGRT